MMRRQTDEGQKMKEEQRAKSDHGTAVRYIPQSL